MSYFWRKCNSEILCIKLFLFIPYFTIIYRHIGDGWKVGRENRRSLHTWHVGCTCLGMGKVLHTDSIFTAVPLQMWCTISLISLQGNTELLKDTWQESPRSFISPGLSRRPSPRLETPLRPARLCWFFMAPIFHQRILCMDDIGRTFVFEDKLKITALTMEEVYLRAKCHIVRRI